MKLAAETETRSLLMKAPSDKSGVPSVGISQGEYSFSCIRCAILGDRPSPVEAERSMRERCCTLQQHLLEPQLVQVDDTIMSLKVVIVGGGIAGLCAAVSLCQAGHAVKVCLKNI